MVALSAVRRCLHLPQEPVHLGKREPAPRAHAAMAGERRADALECVQEAERLIDLGVDAAKIEISGNIKYDAIDLALPASSERAALRLSFGIAANPLANG